MSEVKKVIHHRAFKDKVFYENRQKMTEFLKGIIDLPIDNQLFKIMRIVIKFFRFPLLILLKPIYNKIEQEKQKNLVQNHQDLKKVASYVRQIVQKRKLPSLQFYFKAGYDLGAVCFDGDNGQNLMNYIEKIQVRLQDLIGLENFQQKKILISIEQNLQKAISSCSVVIQSMCLEEYLKEIRNRRLQIENEMNLQMAPLVKYQRTKGRRIKIQGPQEKEIDDEKAANDYLCCRSYFYQNEIIDEPETLIQQYKNYQYPFDSYLSEILLKTICGFLNCRGGIIYIGIREKNETKKRTVVGQRYTQNAKQDVLKYFRLLCQRKIFPEMISCQFYKIQFVPLKDPFRKEWIPGKFVVRVRVQKGDRRELYTFQKANKEQMFAFRTQNEVLTHRMGQNILEIFRKRLTSADQQEDWLNHPGPCRQVEMGKQLCVRDRSDERIDLPWSKKDRVGTGRQSSNRKVEKCMPTYICEKQDVIPQLQKYNWKTTKRNLVYTEARNGREMEEIDSIIVNSGKARIRKVSKKIKFKNIGLKNLQQQLLKNSLYTVISDDTLVMHSVEQVVFAEEILKRATVEYQFQFDII